MSSLVSVYQGNTLRLNLSFTDEVGTPLNLSGCVVYYTALPSYTQNDSPLFNVSATGDGSNVDGTIALQLSSQDTNQCVGDYPAWITYSGNSQIQTYGTDGFRIIAAPNVF